MSGRVAIIGGGPAGAAAAFHLARAGFAVTVLESRAFPRTKVCGEFISPAATSVLEAILPPQQLRHAGAQRVDRFVLQLGDRSRTLRMATPAWALSRRTLDELLLERAIVAGAQVRQPAPVVSIDHAPPAPQGPVAIHLACGESLAADMILHADGHGRFCATGPTPTARGLLGHKCHFTSSEPIEGVTIRSCRGAYIGTIGVEASSRDGPAPTRHATIALVARRELLAGARGDIDAMVAALWPGWEPCRRSGPWLSCGVARSGYQTSGHARALRLGNAAGAVDPIGGEGIGLALWSGTLAARLLTTAFDGGAWTASSLAEIGRRYAAAYRRRLCVRRPACRLAAGALIRPGLVGALWPLLGLEPLTLGAWYVATGKPVLCREP